MVKKKIIAGIGTLALSLGIVGSAFAATTTSDVNKELAQVRNSTTKYHDVNEALKDGYVPVGESVAVPGLGTMGIHYINFSLMGEGKVDKDHPEALLYVPTKNGVKLVGVEYVVSVAEWAAAGHQVDGSDNPTVFGESFEGPMEGHGPGEPSHFDKHVWLWHANPSGMFAQFNPAIKSE
ncbi:hypothetical protein ACT8ZR_24390 [Neobacillus sp. M.A.Huq-85]|nr:hypothetical protein QNK12_19970 [Neobacillus cucumis]